MRHLLFIELDSGFAGFHPMSSLACFLLTSSAHHNVILIRTPATELRDTAKQTI